MLHTFLNIKNAVYMSRHNIFFYYGSVVRKYNVYFHFNLITMQFYLALVDLKKNNYSETQALCSRYKMTGYMTMDIFEKTTI